MSPHDDATLFPKLDDRHIACVLDIGQKITLAKGDDLFREGEGTADFYVVLEGRLKVTQKVGEEDQILALHEAREFTGAADMLTGADASATGRALEPTRVIRLDRSQLRQVMVDCPDLGDMILGALTARTNTEYAHAVQKEKMAGLGRLAAGLAHELNNPAAAAERAADSLVERLDDFEALTARLLRPVLLQDTDGDQLEAARDARSFDEDLDPLERSDREDALADWLEARGVPEPWDLASTLSCAGYDRDLLETLAEGLRPERVDDFLGWLGGSIAMRTLAQDLVETTQRMSSLVKAMKSYSFMDREACREPIEIATGLRTTATILGHKIRGKGIRVRKKLPRDLPTVWAFGGELNQVWTNLLDNAIDAVEDGGEIILQAVAEDDDVLVQIIDDGAGIPEEDQARVFEPFYTTKGVGQGTGLGLDTVRRIIVERHSGTLRFDSEPGRTCFEVRLPIAPPADEDD